MDASALEPFSARNRGAQKPIDNDFPTTARIGLLHLVNDAVESGYVEGWGAAALELLRVGRRNPTTYPANSTEAIARAKADAESLIRQLPWEKVLDFCERLYSKLARDAGQWIHDEGW